MVSPEFNNNSQLIFRDNLMMEIRGKNVMILMAMVTTGKSLNKAIECVQYYQGNLTGISSIFSAKEEFDGYPVFSVFGLKDVPDYQGWDYRECPLCKAGKKLDALVNAYGYAAL